MTERPLPTLEQLIRRHIRRRVTAALFILIATVAVVTIIEGLLSVSHRIDNLKNRSSELQDRVISEIMVMNQAAIDAIIADANANYPYEQVEWRSTIHTIPGNLEQIHWDWHGNWVVETTLRTIGHQTFGSFVFRGNLFQDESLVSALTSRICLSLLFCTVLMALLLPVARQAPSKLMLQPMQRLLALINPGNKTHRQNDKIQFKEALDLELELKRLLQDRAAKQAEQLELERSTAIAQAAQMLAHDIRRPIILLKEIVDVISDIANLDEARTFASKALPRVQVAYQSLDRMLDEFIMLGRSNDIPMERVSITHVIEKAVASTITPDSAVDRNTILDVSSDLYVMGHDAHLERVVSNLMTNAIEAMGKNGSLKISAQREGDQVAVCIANTGSYIPPNEQADIFKLFYTKGKKTGSGLGLAICKRLVTDHAGSITVDSSIANGTVFIIHLPYCNDIGEQKSNAGVKLEHKSILIADDSPAYLQSMTEIVNQYQRSAEVTCTQASSAEDALKLVASKKFDAIIMDINFAHHAMDGISAVRNIRRQGVTARIVIHSNDSSPDIQKAALRAGADLFVRKPMSLAAINAALN